MTLKIAVNGLGRIGRCVVRAVCEQSSEQIKLVAVNGTMPIESYKTLIKYDSVHGIFPQEISTDTDTLFVGKNKVKFFNERSLGNIPWGKENVDIVFECTGKFKDKDSTAKHLKAGAKKVIISAPGKDVDATIIFGVNNHLLRDNYNVISVGSCTTNALAPLVKTLHDSIGIEQGYMTTVHSYTNDQKVLDGSHNDLRRARACHLSMIPTTTGAAKMIGVIIPELAGRIAGSAIRVPTPNVSLIDFVFSAKRETSKEEINKIMQQASESSMKNIVAVAKQKLVSIDFNHSVYSAVFDPFETQVVDEKLVRVVAWYDNEWGFTHRMIDVALLSETLAIASV
ncbi:MAG: type I glyceraldehyde-3-phosphate dehydrogenase [Rickettsiales bacterium]|nr:type I glyceraldehyde-3-phosphate dehydrogenase [Rickettsiales bacterium]